MCVWDDFGFLSSAGEPVLSRGAPGDQAGRTTAAGLFYRVHDEFFSLRLFSYRATVHLPIVSIFRLNLSKVKADIFTGSETEPLMTIKALN